MTIREVSSSDLDKLSPILSDEATMKYTATGAQTHEQMIAFVENCARQYREQGFGHWAIFISETNELVGLCGLNRHQIDGEEYMHVNYRLGSQYQGKGLATETVKGVMDYCANSLKLNHLSAIIEPSNTSSIKVIERLGFKFRKQTRFKNLNVNIYQVSM
ncbi:GNAT family N-acetyltransferase [Thalassomonas sp. RHCl1]|uniref:GNAT family N-acetyltransferase n=1 Tax=Thalassomonas sp. RHCl1 TaxID=2995320 RepID=UPI00248C1A5B|nr:GNAT family N-acetyltransferase [Thalassomonas sp. RHCl1]